MKLIIFFVLINCSLIFAASSDCTCVSCGGDKNAKPGCGTNCGKKCSDVGKKGPFACTLKCIKDGCECKDGFYYEACSKKCVKPCDCPCKRDEVFVKCPDEVCEPKTCKEVGFPLNCPDCSGGCPSKPGCICVEGYVRNNKGICVPARDCPSCGGDENATPGCGTNCGKKCTDVGKKGPFPCPRICNLNACDCKEGYYYDQYKKKCVLPCDCIVCGDNEEYVDCVETHCYIKDCKDLGFPLNCKKKNKDGSCPGKPGCVCKSGYARNENGKCIKVKECPSCGGDKNAESGCGSNCGKKCTDVGKTGPFKCAPCKYNSCDCKKGYYYDQKLQKCVEPDDCISCNGDKNAKPGCGTYCGKRCSDVGRKGPFVCTLECMQDGCDCKDGFYYDEYSKKCVRPRDCPCKKDEVFVQCPDAVCAPKKCTEVGFPLNCPDCSDRCPSKPGCICVNGYVRDKNGICIPARDCPSCGGDENATPGCGTNCGKKCTDVGKKGPFPCPRICNLNGCDCKDGYYYDQYKKKCVLPCDCIVCGDNEEYVDCVETHCYIKYCKDLGYPLNCKEKNKDGSCPGKPGCVCKSGYARNENGKCIKVTECPSCGGDKNAESGCGSNCGKKCTDIGQSGPFKCAPCKYNSCDCRKGYYYDLNQKKCVKSEDCVVCKDDEEYKDCMDTYCLIKECKELGFSIKCKDKPQDGSCPGKPGCICANGTVRNNNGKCVKRDECPSCGGDDNAQSGCGNNCRKMCSDVGKKGPFKCPIGCIYNGCTCRDGFYYDPAVKKCVQPCDCTCKPNEIFVQCPEAVCKPKTCKEVGFPLDCPDCSNSCPSKPGCICQEGYARNCDGDCVPVKECPSCGGDENATPGCGTNCGRKCSDVGKEGPFACPAICLNNACDCKDGYYLNEETKKCVKPCDCPPPPCD